MNPSTKQKNTASESGLRVVAELYESAGFDLTELNHIDRSVYNSRRSMRRAVHTECTVVAEDGFRLIGNHTLNISDEGILVRGLTDVEVGEPVFVALQIPDGSSWVDAGGTVARKDGDLVAVRIHTMTQVDRALYLGSIRRYPPMIPPNLRKPDYASHILRLAVA